jgi:hypothetical protein
LAVARGVRFAASAHARAVRLFDSANHFPLTILSPSMPSGLDRRLPSVATPNHQGFPVMNMHVSPAAIADRRPTKTSDPDAALKATVAAHGTAVRLTVKRKREADALVARHPHLASEWPTVMIPPCEFLEVRKHFPAGRLAKTEVDRIMAEGVRVQCGVDYRRHLGFSDDEELPPAVSEHWEAVQRRLEEAAPAHRKARQAAGIEHAQVLCLRTASDEEQAFLKVLRISPSTRNGCRLMARFVARALPRLIDGGLNRGTGPFSPEEFRDWNWRRSQAFDFLKIMLRRLAE